MPRTFANPSGITCSAGAVGTLLGNAFTFAAICRRTSDSDYHALISLEGAGPDHRGGLWITNGGGSGGDLQIVSSGFDTSFGFTIPNNTWVFLAVTKPDGDGVTPSGWMYRYDTDSWSTGSGVGTVNEDSTTITAVRIGNSEGVDFWFIGDIAIDAGWSAALADAQIRQLPFSLQAWYGSSPTFGHLLDQQATGQNVLDFTGGGANQTALTNTTVSTQSVPVFSYGFTAVTPHNVPAAGGTTFTQSLAGATTPSAALTRQTGKPFTGSTTPSGTPAKQAAKTLSGAITPAGALLKVVGRLLSGSITPGGAAVAVRTILLSISGSTTPGAALTRQANKTLTGSATPTGAVTKNTAKTFTGSTGPAGAVLKLLSRLLGGSVTPSGSVATESADSRNLQLDLGAPDTTWHVGPPAAKWTTEPAAAKWQTGNPHT